MCENDFPVLSVQDLAAVVAAIETIHTKLSFLTTLSQEERRILFRISAKSTDFIQDASEVVKIFPEILPPGFNQQEYLKEAELVRVLTIIKTKLDLLHEKVDDTLMMVANEAMNASLDVYSCVNTEEARRPGLKKAADKLKARIKKKRSETVRYQVYFD